MDMITRIMVEKYGKKRDPNAHVYTAPIDVYDLAKIIIEQDAEIERLKALLAEKE